MPYGCSWQHKEHPNMQSKNQEILKNYFSHIILPQIKSAIQNDKEKLNDQHWQKKDRNYIVLEVGYHSAISFSRLKCDKSFKK